MRLQLFNQSAFVLHAAAGGAVAVDLGYEVPATTVANLSAATAIVSHKHPDHLHRPHLEALRARVFGPPDVAADLAGLDVTVIRPGDIFTVTGIEVTVFASDHGPNLTAEIDNLGLAFAANGRRLLFLGDMAAVSHTPPGPWDVILVPVGGSKVFTAEAAAGFIATLGHAGRVVPIHFHGRSDPASGKHFHALAQAHCDVRLLDVGESLEV